MTKDALRLWHYGAILGVKLSVDRARAERHGSADIHPEVASHSNAAAAGSAARWPAITQGIIESAKLSFEFQDFVRSDLSDNSFRQIRNELCASSNSRTTVLGVSTMG